MNRTRGVRRSVAVLITFIVAAVAVLQNPDFYQSVPLPTTSSSAPTFQPEGGALAALEVLAVKGRAPKSGYSREQFGDGWQSYDGCDTRNLILKRDLVNTVINSKCQVVTGLLHDAYTGKTVPFRRGEISSQDVQIDHVVALSDAWQKGAQQLTPDQRISFSNDPLELLAVEGNSNQEKSASDAASWLPPNKAFRCQYVARQIAVKKKYGLWITESEKVAMGRVLTTCPGQKLPQGS